ncbi:helix-turn-helix domain-containing protein [Quadrisphaera sp. DSM 44207]|uniref:helix-turn-helix domain-containing protein n=1 Tax=Quadrisphaera sp. DSM 44207 TaxID=1881057 RepID=UPI00088CA3C3|nr:helix-turn-helix domain-containing protein [Quadrisphaera sp. DSM 44207]SDQ08808.1 transcriptional regulator, AlpA family [Quadrisphaera sp. DSM 44207]
MPPRFLTLADVAEVLNVSAVQAMALVKRGELPAIQVGGRGQWRVEAAVLEEYIQRKYAETRAMLDARTGPDAGPRSQDQGATGLLD